MANLGYLQLTRNCYQKCQFCSNPPTGVHLDEEEMRANIDRLVEMGYDGVILTGGEPSISELLFPALALRARAEALQPHDHQRADAGRQGRSSSAASTPA